MPELWNHLKRRIEKMINVENIDPNIKVEESMSQEVVCQEVSDQKIIKYEPEVLHWFSFNQEPEIDRYILVWSYMGQIQIPFFITYRNSLGEYDMPNLGKKYVMHAWAYLNFPKIL